jgi:NAD-dependent SIR2 family protein deacetylase
MLNNIQTAKQIIKNSEAILITAGAGMGVDSGLPDFRGLNLVKIKTENYFIFTSNVDGQFTKAGFDTDKMLEVHGSIHHLQCSKNCTSYIWENDEIVNVDMESFQAANIPVCPKCTEVARPNE